LQLGGLLHKFLISTHFLISCERTTKKRKVIMR